VVAYAELHVESVRSLEEVVDVLRTDRAIDRTPLDIPAAITTGRDVNITDCTLRASIHHQSSEGLLRWICTSTCAQVASFQTNTTSTRKVVRNILILVQSHQVGQRARPAGTRSDGTVSTVGVPVVGGVAGLVVLVHTLRIRLGVTAGRDQRHKQQDAKKRYDLGHRRQVSLR